jgi:hypothetical protein
MPSVLPATSFSCGKPRDWSCFSERSTAASRRFANRNTAPSATSAIGSAVLKPRELVTRQGASHQSVSIRLETPAKEKCPQTRFGARVGMVFGKGTPM